ncbi:MAG: hypothetical protein U0R17_00570 [Acidimicrobiia bacterium]
MHDINTKFEIFNGSIQDFLTETIHYLEPNSIYRGYSELISYVKSIDYSNHSLYRGYVDDVVCCLAAVNKIGTTLYFDVFVVDKEFREIGVGDEFFTWITNQHQDAKTYESTALPGDRSTKNFFEQRSGKARLLIIQGKLTK